MIGVQARLYCDACHSQFTALAGGREGIRRDALDRLRIVARAMGWRRFRPEVTGELRDYCPACVAESGRGEVRRGRPPKRGRATGGG